MSDFVFGPNSGAPDLLAHIADPSKWVTPHCQTMELDAWHFVYDPNPAWLGDNIFSSIRAVGLQNIPNLQIAFEACKEHDPTGEKNLAKWNQVIRPRVEAAGGTIAAVSLDEPLTSTVQGRWARPGVVYPWQSVGDVIPHVARFIGALGLPVHLYEAWPNHSTETILEFIEDLSLERFVLDVDVTAMQHGDDLVDAMDRIGGRCEEKGIEFAVAGTGMGQFSNDAAFLASLRLWLARIIPLVQYVTIESWHELRGKKEIPTCQGLAGVLDWADRTYNPAERAHMAEHTAEDFRLWAKQSRADMGDVLGIPHRQVTNVEGVGNLMWHRYMGKSRAEVKQIFIDHRPQPDPEPFPIVDPSMKFTGTYLYSGHRETNGDPGMWLAASQYIPKWSPEKQHEYNQTQVGNNTIVVAFNTGYRKELQEIPFSCLNGSVGNKLALSAITQANRGGLAVWAYLMTQEYGEQSLGLGSGSWDGISDSKFDDLIDALQRTMALIKGRVPAVTPFREIGDKFSGKSLGRRNRIFAAIRAVDPDVAIACHERSLEGVPVSDFGYDVDERGQSTIRVAEPTLSALQTGFGTSVGDAAEFIRASVARMKAKIPGHRVGLFEAHIPPNVYSSRVTPTSLERAREESRQIMERSGAAFDMNGGTQ